MYNITSTLNINIIQSIKNPPIRWYFQLFLIALQCGFTILISVIPPLWQLPYTRCTYQKAANTYQSVVHYELFTLSIITWHWWKSWVMTYCIFHIVSWFNDEIFWYWNTIMLYWNSVRIFHNTSSTCISV